MADFARDPQEKPRSLLRVVKVVAKITVRHWSNVFRKRYSLSKLPRSILI